MQHWLPPNVVSEQQNHTNLTKPKYFAHKLHKTYKIHIEFTLKKEKRENSFVSFPFFYTIKRNLFFEGICCTFAAK
jgi:hypothetical protein